MSPKYWVSSEDLSADSSVEGSQSISRDHLAPEEGEKNEDVGVSTPEGSIARNFNDRMVARTTGADVMLPRLPTLQPQQHATLFYLSLIEGRCRTQASNTINAGRSLENSVSEDHPEVLGLAQHLFDEMRSELVSAGLIPEDFAAPNLPDLRQYLHSFDNLLNNIATQRAFNLSAQQHNHRTLPRFESSSDHSEVVPYNAGRLVLPPFATQQNRQTSTLFESSLFNSDFAPCNTGQLAIMAPREQQLQKSPPSKLSLFFPKVEDTTLGRSLYVSDYEQ
jgi:eukaryotic translation initiation factor 2-alpha kinase 3